MEERRSLPQSLEESNRAKALTVWERISEDVSCPHAARPVYHLTTLHQYSVHLCEYTPGLKRRDLVAESLFDLQLQRQLEENGSINWCKRDGSLHALKNSGRSNCLLDAVSLCMWGVRDGDMVLRTALYNTMIHSSPEELRLVGQKDWRTAGQRELTSEDWRRALKLTDPRAGAVTSVDNPYQHIHLFLLANIIRRAIIVVGGGEEEEEEDPAARGVSRTGLVGIYLPLLWESGECHTCPVVLGSSSPWRHFAPLVMAGSLREQGGGAALPLVRRTSRGFQSLPLHFAPDQEEGARQRCLRAYLKLTALQRGQRTFCAVRLRGHNLPEHLNLVQDYFRLANHISSQLTQEVKEPKVTYREAQNGPLAPPSSSSSSSSTAFSITRDKCATEHCLYFSSKFTWPLCHHCSGLQQQQQQHPRDCRMGRGTVHPPGSERLEERVYSSSGDFFYRETAPRVQLSPGPSSAPSATSPFSCHSPSQKSDSDADPAALPCVADAWVPPEMSGAEGGVQQPSCQAEEDDFLCGRCLTCKRETRTFNGLCFQCLQSGTTPHMPSDVPPETAGSPGGPHVGKRCLTPGCVYFGTLKHAGYCTVCYCIQKQTAPQAPPTTFSSSSSSSSSSLPLQLSSNLRNLPRCSGVGCDMLGKPGFKGLCERCFLSHHQGLPDSQTPVPTVVRQRSSQPSEGHHRHKQVLPSERTVKTSPHVEERRSPSRSLGKAQALTEPSRPRPCRRKGCTNFGNARCQGLCNSCYSGHNS